MSIYKYPESKVIDEVTFKKTERGAVRAYLHANPELSEDSIRHIIDDLRSRDLECVPFTLAGKPVLEVRGFRKEHKLFEILDAHKWLAGAPAITPDKDDNISWKDKLRKRSLQASGALYAWGDINFFLYGLKGNSPLDMAAGVLYGAPTPILLAYGSNDQSEIQIKDLAKDMAKHFKQQVDTLPDDCSLQALTADHKKGLLNTTDQFFKRYPSEFMNLCYAGAGACIYVAAMKHLRQFGEHGAPEKAIEGWLKHLRKTESTATREMAAAKALKSVKMENYLNAGVGGVTIASGLFGTLVKEKARDPDENKKEGMSGMWEWVRERPLAVAGVGLMVSTLLHAGSTAVALRGQDGNHKKAVVNRAVFVVSALLAELMVAISSKGHGEGVVSDNSVDLSVISIAADLIVKQPRAMQNTLIDHMGAFLGRPDVLAVKDQNATELLRKEVELLRKNPWALAEDRDNYTLEKPAVITPEVASQTVAVDAATPVKETLTDTKEIISTVKETVMDKKEITPSWQAKMATKRDGDVQLQPSA